MPHSKHSEGPPHEFLYSTRPLLLGLKGEIEDVSSENRETVTASGQLIGCRNVGSQTGSPLLNYGICRSLNDNGIPMLASVRVHVSESLTINYAFPLIA